MRTHAHGGRGHGFPCSVAIDGDVLNGAGSGESIAHGRMEATRGGAHITGHGAAREGVAAAAAPRAHISRLWDGGGE